MNRKTILGLLLIVVAGCLWEGAVAPPVDKKNPKAPAPPPHPDNPDDSDAMMDLEYQRYLQEVVNVLETHPEFKKKLEDMDPEDVKKGKIAEHLDDLPYDIRDKLTEAKNKEIERLRDAMRKQMTLEGGMQNIKNPDHIDHGNLNTFEKEDLKKLIAQTTKDLDDLDKKRKKEFKEYEMRKEAKRHHELSLMKEEERKKAEREHEESKKRHKDHPKLKHPGSKGQLEEVWEDVDDLPKEDFNPKTFFRLHDTTGDGYWDDGEVEALFQKELEKVYNESNSDDDINEKYEEMYRMREHLVNEIDTNKDGLISYEEFMESTKSKDFEKDEDWTGLEDEDMYSDEELKKFEEEMAKQNGWQYPNTNQGGGGHPDQGYPNQQMPHPGAGGHPQGQVPMGQHPEQGHPNQQMPYPGAGGHPQGQVPMGQHPQQGQFQGGHPQGGMGIPNGGMGGQHPQAGMGMGGPQADMGGAPHQGGIGRQGVPMQDQPPNQPHPGAAQHIPQAGQPHV